MWSFHTTPLHVFGALIIVKEVQEEGMNGKLYHFASLITDELYRE